MISLLVINLTGEIVWQTVAWLLYTVFGIPFSILSIPSIYIYIYPYLEVYPYILFLGFFSQSLVPHCFIAAHAHKYFFFFCFFRLLFSFHCKCVFFHDLLHFPLLGMFCAYTVNVPGMFMVIVMFSFVLVCIIFLSFSFRFFSFSVCTGYFSGFDLFRAMFEGSRVPTK